MNKIFQYFRTTIGKKIIMALTGLVLFGFVIMHMLGNLKMFAGVNAVTGEYKMDEYARFLREVGAPLFGHGQLLWMARITLLVCVCLHILSAAQLVLLNHRSRPTGYGKKENLTTTFAARTMWVGGGLLLLYIVYHVLHITTGTLHTPEFEHGKVYANVVYAFRNATISLIYVAAMFVLCLHLYHGIWSALQTLGLCNDVTERPLKIFSRIFALVIFLGYSSVPIAVLTGTIPLPR